MTSLSAAARKFRHAHRATDFQVPKFPYCLKVLPGFLATQWDSTEFAPYRDAFPEEHRATPAAFEAHFRDLVARDVKISYLKSLQGYLWADGYDSGAIKAPLFGDVAPAMASWRHEGIKIMVYSSGSVAAQALLWPYRRRPIRSPALHPRLV